MGQCCLHKSQPTKSLGRQCFESRYELLEQLGVGKTAVVYRARVRQPHAQDPSSEFDNSIRNSMQLLKQEQQQEQQQQRWRGAGAGADNQQFVAVKIITKSYLTTETRTQALDQELRILASLHHPNALRLVEVFYEHDRFVIVCQEAPGGQLLDFLWNQQLRLSERQVATVIRDLTKVLVYLHARGITHRDLKLQNVLCKSATSLDDGVVLVDFGLAHQGRVGHRDLTGMNGSSHYMAPECFNKNATYGCEVDIWSLGVLSFVLLTGTFPFDGQFMSQIEDRIVAGELEFPHELSQEISLNAQKFIQYLLVREPSNRPPAHLVLQHPWLQMDTVDAHPLEETRYSDFRMQKLWDLALQKQQLENPLARVQTRRTQEIDQ